MYDYPTVHYHGFSSFDSLGPTRGPLAALEQATSRPNVDLLISTSQRRVGSGSRCHRCQVFPPKDTPSERRASSLRFCLFHFRILCDPVFGERSLAFGRANKLILE